MPTSSSLNTKQRQIVVAALEILDEKGLDELGLRAVADRLDIKAPSLYWHFKSKADLTDAMADAIVRPSSELLKPRTDGESWQEWLIGAVTELRRALLSHRDGGRVVAGARLDQAPALMTYLDTCVESLMSAGLSIEPASLTVDTAIQFVLGNVIENQNSPSKDALKHLNLEQLALTHPTRSRIIELTIRKQAGDRDDFNEALRLIIR